VLVVPRARAGTAAGAPSRVIAAIDERPGGDGVLHAALALAAPHEAHVDAVHVVEGDLREYARGVSRAMAAARPRPDTAAERLRLIAGDALDDVRLCLLAREWAASRLDAAGALRHRSAPIIRLGDAGQEIVAHANRTSAGLIVIGRGGPGADASLARSSGSTARLVLWAAPCPVLLLPLLGARAGSPEPMRDLRRYRPRVAPLVPALPPRNGDHRGGGDAA
jgi:nucleotide-binding universal stress UspA family protein